ncbi:phospholipid phosphatase 5 isoform X2 [Nematostella vectensis]|uniref:phospholipid phosphatase 5 isoform X2 n=1 Tax=Nematostella vectensis TaxID=45351 RepID=UPI00138FCD2B|nr:phospholipid phosphatase 5 isoform X2 [Nematostella vectensis]
MAGCLLNGESHAHLAIEVAVRLVLFIIFLFLEEAKPFIRLIHDEEMWLYKNPRSTSDVIPTPTLFAIVFIVPTVTIIIVSTLRKDKLDARQALLGLYLALALDGVITNIVKIMVGRPRPDFFWRCYPNGVPTRDNNCDGDPDAVMEGRKSFPSGHSSWSFCSLGFLSLYLAGKLQCFNLNGRGYGWRVCLAVAPLLGATAIALTRYSDYKHHWQGMSIAVMCYRQYYPAVNRIHCDLPYCSLHQVRHADEHVLPLHTPDHKSHPAVMKHL